MGAFLNSLAAFASEDESAAVTAGFLVSIEDFVDAAVSFAILERVKKGQQRVLFVPCRGKGIELGNLHSTGALLEVLVQLVVVKEGTHQRTRILEEKSGRFRKARN